MTHAYYASTSLRIHCVASFQDSEKRSPYPGVEVEGYFLVKVGSALTALTSQDYAIKQEGQR